MVLHRGEERKAERAEKKAEKEQFKSEKKAEKVERKEEKKAEKIEKKEEKKLEKIEKKEEKLEKKAERKNPNKPYKTDIVNIQSMNPKTGLIDARSVREYRSAYDQYKAKFGAEAANPKLEAHIETRIRMTVVEQKAKRKRDITTVAASTAAGTVVPFSGIPIMVATTMVQCIGFSASLGLIPIANVRSRVDANTLAKQLTATLTKSAGVGTKAAIEAFILEFLKVGGFGYWLWEEILKGVVVELTAGAVTEAAWVLTPLFAAPKSSSIAN